MDDRQFWSRIFDDIFTVFIHQLDNLWPQEIKLLVFVIIASLQSRLLFIYVQYEKVNIKSFYAVSTAPLSSVSHVCQRLKIWFLLKIVWSSFVHFFEYFTHADDGRVRIHRK